MDQGDPAGAWMSLPRRIYLDTCTLQAVHHYGDVIWDSEPFVPRGRAGRVQGFENDIDALRLSFTINERAMFEFVVTETTLLRSRPATTLGTPNGSTTSGRRG
jgi:hypothetical protein